MKTPYGVIRDADGNYAINEKEADTVRLIFHLYLTGYSLGKIASHLEACLIPSPTDKPKWIRDSIDKMLSNPKYIPLVGMDDYFAAQFEKDSRSNIDEDTGTRKAVRYCSRNVSDGFQISTHL